MTLRSERKMQNFGKQEHHTDQLGSEGKNRSETEDIRHNDTRHQKS